MTEGRLDRDPAEHMLTRRHVDRLPDGTETIRPVPLDEYAASVVDLIEEGRVAEAGWDNDWRTGVVAISKSRAQGLAGLLDELAARLSPGLAVGPIRSDGSMARVAARAATDLERQRHRSPDYD